MSGLLRRLLGLDLPVIAWMLLLFHLASRPPTPAPTGIPIDKVLHFGAYGLLALLVARSWGARLGPKAAGTTAATALILSGLHGLLIELHQMSIPHRTAEWGDVLADLAGAGCLALAWLWWAGVQSSGED